MNILRVLYRGATKLSRRRGSYAAIPRDLPDRTATSGSTPRHRNHPVSAERGRRSQSPGFWRPLNHRTRPTSRLQLGHALCGAWSRRMWETDFSRASYARIPGGALDPETRPGIGPAADIRNQKYPPELRVPMHVSDLSGSQQRRFSINGPVGTVGHLTSPQAECERIRQGSRDGLRRRGQEDVVLLRSWVARSREPAIRIPPSCLVPLPKPGDAQHPPPAPIPLRQTVLTISRRPEGAAPGLENAVTSLGCPDMSVQGRGMSPDRAKRFKSDSGGERWSAVDSAAVATLSAYIQIMVGSETRISSSATDQ